MSEDYGRNQNAGNNYSGRKQSVHKYGDNKGKNYSPSASYNYQNSQGRGQGQGYQQHPRRRIDRYKRENFNFSDKLIKQNDIIIRLLKEIRDGLTGSSPIVADSESKEIKGYEKTSVSAENEKETPVEASEPTEDAISQGSEDKVSDNEATQPAVSESEEIVSDDEVTQAAVSEPEETTSDISDK